MATTDKRIEQTKKLIDWCRSQAGPFLAKHHGPDRSEQLQRDLEDLVKSLEGIEQELSVCFLGAAGVGKSTLINALVAGRESILPAGGVGPLTAQALTVRHSPEPRFEVSYHSLQRLWQLVFGLRKMYESELGDTASIPTSEVPLDDAALEEVQEKLAPDETRQQKFQEFRKTAQLLIKGNQDGEERVDYLLDRLHEAVGQPTLFATTATPEDAARITRLQDALERARDGRRSRYDLSSGEAAFRAELTTHATGFLAPLIQDLTVYWNGELLQSGIQLVDLPGVGIAGDVYRDVTRRHIREKADAVVLVVGRAGITEPDVEMLKSTEFLTRLLHPTDPRTRPMLLVTVVRVDDVAIAQFDQDGSVSEVNHFTQLCTQFDRVIRNQLRTELETVWSPQNGIGEGKRDAVERILNTLQVHPLSAVQYRQFLAGSRRAFVEDAEQSRLPHLSRALRDIAEARRQTRIQDLWAKSVRIHARVMADVKVIRGEWRREDRAVAEAERLRSEVLAFMAPLREELLVRQGQYREFLKATVPQQIEAMVIRAQAHARKDITGYLRRLQDVRWNVLKAAVVRGGTFVGTRRIDLPQDFGLRFEEPIAEVWGTEILKKVRQRTKQYAEDCVALVEKVVVWAKQQGARVPSDIIEAQRDAIRADAANLTAVGRDLVNDLSDRVKNTLIKQIEPPIRRRCKKFVEAKESQGKGVKGRMLDLFDELAEDVIEAAGKPATEILTRLYEGVHKEIDDVFKNWQDPLQSVTDVIVVSQEKFLQRSDRQKRERVLAAVEAVLAAHPPELQEAEAEQPDLEGEVIDTIPAALLMGDSAATTAQALP